MFPYGVSSSGVFDKILIEMPTDLPQYFPEKFLVARLHSGIILFAKHSILNV